MTEFNVFLSLLLQLTVALKLVCAVTIFQVLSVEYLASFTHFVFVIIYKYSAL